MRHLEKRARPAIVSLVAFGTVSLVAAFSHSQSSSKSTRHRSQISSAADVTNGERMNQRRSPKNSEPLQLSEVNVVFDTRSSLVYDPMLQRYVKRTLPKSERIHDTTIPPSSAVRMLPNWLRNNYFLRTCLFPRLAVAFIPSGVTLNYYRFMVWRLVQRFINAILHVFGTQSLLLGLGIKSSSSQLGALSAALNWVLKDALGKIVRMIWASKMGLRFDSDAKRWRIRSAFVYAAGNGLEISTYIFPQLFLLWATLANCCKQISMLTSSSTKSSIFNAFRDGSRENIGDITAKGEAQVAIVDLLGIATGVGLSKAVVGTSVRSVLLVYFVLQACEIVCVYRQLRAVEYRVFNFERMMKVITDFCKDWGTKRNTVETPGEMARKERMFLPTEHLSRRSIAYGSLGRSKLTPDELNQLISICERERFLLVVGANKKHPKKKLRLLTSPRQQKAALQENCHIVLHTEATNADIVKSALALTVLREKLSKSQHDPDSIRCFTCFSLIEESLREASEMFGPLLQQMSKQGWETPARYMFGRVRMRTDWPLSQNCRQK